MINLLPPLYKAELLYARRNYILRRYVSLVALVGFAMSAILISATWFTERETAQLERTLADIESEFSAYRDVEAQATTLSEGLDAVKELFDKQTNYLAVLEDIERATVSNAQLQSISLIGDDTKPLNLQFTVPSETVAASLRISLENSERFSFVDIESIGAQDDGSFTVSYKLAFEKGKAR